MTLQDFQDAFTLWLSGAGQMKNNKEMWWEIKIDDENEVCAYYEGNITIEFLNLSVKKTIVRQYYKNGNMRYEDHYKNGLGSWKMA